VTSIVQSGRLVPEPVSVALDDARGSSWKTFKPGTAVSAWWLALICGLQAIAANLPGTNGNAFEDEGLYVFIGHRMIQHIIHGTHVTESPGAYFSGAPGLYPPLAAVADSLAGLAGARELSLLFAMLATVCVRGVAARLFGSTAGLFAAVTFALSGSVLFQSHFATFDAMAMFLMAAAAWLAVASAERDGLLWAPVVGLVLASSFLTKYGTGVYAPVICLLAVAVGWGRFRWVIVFRAAFTLCAAGAISYFVVEYWAADIVPGLISTTSRRLILDPASRGTLLRQTLTWLGPSLIVAAVAAVRHSRRYPGMVAALLLGAVAVPIQHIRIGEAESLSKHLAFSLVFLSPLVGAALGRLFVKWRGLGKLSAVGLTMAMAGAGIVLAHVFLTTWVDDRALLPVLRSAAAAAPGKAVLGEQPSPQRYELRTALRPSQWQDTYSMSYGGLTGLAAFELAIQQSHFGVIYLSFVTPVGASLHEYLTSSATPYELTGKAPRYLHGKIVGYWLIYTPKVLAE
jgi:4-amino-4-deoxy-L-arabinose transferase-like glycosyltransferase